MTVDTGLPGSVRPIKSLGQNFLKDATILERIVAEAKLTKQDTALEIGAGTGALTSVLAKNAGLVYAVEIDKYLMPLLKKKFANVPNIVLVHQDVLKLDFSHGIVHAMEAAEAGGGASDERIVAGAGKFKIVANLPYYITTPIIMKFLEELPEPSEMIFMVQKEVAERIAAKPGCKQYGALTVVAQYYARTEYLFTVEPESFYPKPEVDSAVIRLVPHEQPAVEVRDKQYFLHIIKAAFGQRRKTLVNALVNSGVTELDKAAVTVVLEKTGIDANARGETLSIEQFATLSNELCKN